MGRLVRFGVSLDDELLEPFDDLCKKKGYATRSEAIRDLIRSSIAQEQYGNKIIAGGTLTLVYDHHKHDLARRLMAIQHADHDIIVTGMHVHIDHANCLEVLVLKGESERVRMLAARLVSCRGVKYGVFNPVPEGADLA